MARVTLENITKSFGAVEVIGGVDLEVASGELCVFVGPSGSGKSTLLRIVAGLEEATSGNIKINDEIVNELEPVRRGTAMVFQSYALYPHMTVFRNIGFGLRIARMSKDQIDRKVREVAHLLQLTPLLDRLPRELSGGQKQRVAIGRALVRRPNVFLFDEPLSNLDAALRVQMRMEIARLHNRLDTTMIYVTHDQVEAMTLADRIVVLNNGGIEQVGSPLDLYRKPANTFVAGFIGSPRMNILAFDTFGHESGDPVRNAIRLGGEYHALVASRLGGEGASLGIRPEHFSIGQGGDVECQGTVELVEHLGDETVLNVKLADGRGEIVVRVDGETAIRPGDDLTVHAVADRCHLFGPDGTRVET